MLAAVADSEDEDDDDDDDDSQAVGTIALSKEEIPLPMAKTYIRSQRPRKQSRMRSQLPPHAQMDRALTGVT